MTFSVKTREVNGRVVELEVEYGNRDAFVVSDEFFVLFNEAKDQLRSRKKKCDDYCVVMEVVRILKNERMARWRLFLELAVFARIKLDIHPRDIPSVMRELSGDQRRTFNTINANRVRSQPQRQMAGAGRR